MSLKESLQTKVIVALVLITTLIVCLFGVRDYLGMREKRLADLESSGRLIAERLAQSQVRAVWDFDPAQGDKLIQAEMGDTNLAAVLVVDAKGKAFTGLAKAAGGIVHLETDPVGPFKEFSAPLVRQDKEIGQAKVFMTTSVIEQELARSVRNIVINTIAIDVLLVIALFVLIRFLLIKPLGRIEAFAGDVGQGNLDARLDGAFGGELGALKLSIERMVANLKKTIVEVGLKEREATESATRAEMALEEAEQARLRAERSRCEGLYEAAKRLGSLMENLSSASTELDAQVEQVTRDALQQQERNTETATAMEEMSGTVLEVARNADDSAGNVDTVRDKAFKGSELVQNAVTSINAVRCMAVKLKDDMGRLGENANAIGRIMVVINDIADQTNLLALNAAIEAARAGEAGRGFAVVADEVRKLAEKTMTATREVGEAISAIQAGTQKNLDGMNQTAEAIEGVTGAVNTSGMALEEIVTLIDSASDQVRRIATAAEQQSASTDTIRHAIDDMRTISNHTAEGMGQAREAVTQLAHLASDLMVVVDDLRREGQGASSEQFLPLGA